MPELSLDSATEEAAKSSGGGLDLMGLFDELEEAQERLMNNPQLAQMLGIDLDAFKESMEEAQEDGESTGVELNAETLIAMLQGVEQQGFGDKSVTEIRQWVENNPQQVDNLIRQNS